MEEIQFDEDQERQYSVKSQQPEGKPYLIRLVLATGIVSTDKMAEYVLLGIVLLSTIIAIYISIPNRAKNTISHPPGSELLVPGLPSSSS